MSIYRRASGRWAVLVDVDRGGDGKRSRRALGTYATKKDAERAEREALAVRDRGMDLSPRNVTLGEVVNRFLREAKTRLSPTTTHRYEELWTHRIAPSLAGVPVARLRPAHITDLYTRLRSEPIYRGRPLSARTVHHVHRFLHRVLVWAERLNLVERSVVRAVDPPRPGPSPARALTPDEAARFLAASEGTPFHSFFVVALTTGMRRGELGGLTWGAVDFDQATVSVRQAVGSDRRGGYFLKPTKTGRERSVPLTGLAIEALGRQRAAQAADRLAIGAAYDDRGFVFADPLGAPIELDSTTKAFTTIARSAGIKGVRLHDLRHSAATWALARGSDVRTVSAVLGHSVPSTTLNIYGHVVAGLQNRAVEVIAETLTQAQSRRLTGETRPA
jgi:integrase